MKKKKVLALVVVCMLIIGLFVCAADAGKFSKISKENKDKAKRIASDITFGEGLDFLLEQASEHLGKPMGDVQRDVLSNTLNKLKNKRVLADEVENALLEELQDENLLKSVRDSYNGQLIHIKASKSTLDWKIKGLEDKLRNLG